MELKGNEYHLNSIRTDIRSREFKMICTDKTKSSTIWIWLKACLSNQVAYVCSSYLNHNFLSNKTADIRTINIYGTRKKNVLTCGSDECTSFLSLHKLSPRWISTSSSSFVLFAIIIAKFSFQVSSIVLAPIWDYNKTKVWAYREAIYRRQIRWFRNTCTNFEGWGVFP